jgi:WD40 repeat protein
MTNTSPVAAETEIRNVEARVTRALALHATPRIVDGRRIPPLAYLRRHLVDHAAAGHALDDRVLSAEILPFVDPNRLRLAAARAQESGLLAVSQPTRRRIDAFRRSTHRWDWNRPDSNAGCLSLCSAALGHLGSCDSPGTWHTCWAQWAIGQGEVIGDPLTGHTGGVYAVATGVRPDGRAVAVTGGWDATVRVWDLTAGAPVGEPLTGHTGTVAAVATGVLPDGRPVAVTGGWDATVRVWDLATGAPVGEPLTGHTGAVYAVATGVLPDGRPVAVTGSYDATVRVWDLTTGGPIGHPLPTIGGVRALALAATREGRLSFAIVGTGIACIHLDI